MNAEMFSMLVPHILELLMLSCLLNTHTSLKAGQSAGEAHPKGCRGTVCLPWVVEP
jgi:hypothetical protein